MATTQVGSPPYVFSLLLARATGVKVTLVPHKSGVDGITAVMRGDVQIFVDAPTIIAPQVIAGAVKALAVTGGHAKPNFLGFQPFGSRLSFGAGGSLDRPCRASTYSLADRFTHESSAGCDPWRCRFSSTAREAKFRTHDRIAGGIRTLIQEDHARWGSLICDAGIRVD